MNKVWIWCSNFVQAHIPHQNYRGRTKNEVGKYHECSHFHIMFYPSLEQNLNSLNKVWIWIIYEQSLNIIWIWTCFEQLMNAVPWMILIDLGHEQRLNKLCLSSMASKKFEQQLNKMGTKFKFFPKNLNIMWTRFEFEHNLNTTWTKVEQSLNTLWISVQKLFRTHILQEHPINNIRSLRCSFYVFCNGNGVSTFKHDILLLAFASFSHLASKI